MIGITWIHIAGGMVALLCGTVAVAVRKGSGMHISAGSWFCVAMLVLGVTASILAPFKSPPDSPIGGIMVCYFVATTVVALLFFQLGLTRRNTALRVIYLDAILYFLGGLIGTGHHWYFNGQSHFNMALSAMFSVLEVVPLTLLTLDAWDFVRTTRRQCNVCGEKIYIPHKWTFYFLMAVGFWNFVGAGMFGFLINLPIVSYFEVGTILTANHAHAALMGVFGMLALAMMVFVLRQTTDDTSWPGIEKYIRIGFWGTNAGLAMMVALSPFPGDVVFIVFGAAPLAIAAIKGYVLRGTNNRRPSSASGQGL